MCLHSMRIWLVLEFNKIKDTIAQVYTPSQRHMKNAWIEMVLCSLCFAIYQFFIFWFIHKMTFIPLHTSFTDLFQPYWFSCLIFY